MKKSVTFEQESKKRRRELLIAVCAAAVLALIFLLESRIARSAEDIPFAGHLLLFALLTVVTLLLILVIFFLVRNFFKLVFERRGKVLGAQLKTRLTLAFVALTLVPTVVLFIASAGVLHTTIESWFKTQVEESLQSSLVVAQAYYKNAADKVSQDCIRLADLISNDRFLAPSHRAELQDTLTSWRVAHSLSAVHLYFRDGSAPLITRDKELANIPMPPPRPSFLRIAYKGKSTAKIIPLDSGSDLIRGVAPVKAPGSAQTDAALVVDHFIPTSLAARLLSISNAFGDYQEAKRMKGPVKTMYILILLMVALLVIFIGFWIGVSMARDITDPLLSLAKGTEQIAAGHLDVYIEPVADDELGVLVRSFNKMAADLRKGREELLRVNMDLESRRRYTETVLRNVAAGVLALDSRGNITAVNDSAIRRLGITDEESGLLGKPLLEVLPETSRSAVEETLEQLTTAQAETVEHQMTLSFPERVVTLICFGSSLRDEENHDLGAVLVFENMTHLIKAQRMAAWREVARRIAHEIKNPLTPIQLNAQRLRRKYLDTLGKDGDVLDQATRTIVDQVEQLKALVNEFSKFARMPSATPVPNDLNLVLQETVDFYLQGNDGISFSFSPNPSVPIFDFDREQVKRAMGNLINNAMAAAGPGGFVHVSTRYDPVLSIVSVDVSDNGPGIDPRDRDRLFEPYFTRKAGGTGLGLTIVNTIVTDHNGFVRVKDREGGGATFTLEFPVRKR